MYSNLFISRCIHCLRTLETSRSWPLKVKTQVCPPWWCRELLHTDPPAEVADFGEFGERFWRKILENEIYWSTETSEGFALPLIKSYLWLPFLADAECQSSSFREFFIHQHNLVRPVSQAWVRGWLQRLPRFLWVIVSASTTLVTSFPKFKSCAPPLIPTWILPLHKFLSWPKWLSGFRSSHLSSQHLHVWLCSVPGHPSCLDLTLYHLEVTICADWRSLAKCVHCRFLRWSLFFVSGNELGEAHKPLHKLLWTYKQNRSPINMTQCNPKWVTAIILEWTWRLNSSIYFYQLVCL